jgi:hypothetical protein
MIHLGVGPYLILDTDRSLQHLPHIENVSRPIASTLCTGFFGVERLSEPSPLSVTVRYGRYTSIARLS